MPQAFLNRGAQSPLSLLAQEGHQKRSQFQSLVAIECTESKCRSDSLFRSGSPLSLSKKKTITNVRFNKIYCEP